MRRFPVLFTVVTLSVSSLLFALPVAHAQTPQASLSFSGGNNSPLVITLNTPLVYTITEATTNGPLFVFDEVSPSALPFTSGSGTITFSVNGGSATTLDGVDSGEVSSSVSFNDLFFTNTGGRIFAAGDVVTVTSGTFTTNSNIASLPTSGTFVTFIANGFGQRVSTFGVAAPEPASLALIAFVGAGLFARRQRACHS